MMGMRHPPDRIPGYPAVLRAVVRQRGTAGDAVAPSALAASGRTANHRTRPIHRGASRHSFVAENRAVPARFVQ